MAFQDRPLHEEDPATRVARDLAYGQEGSPWLKGTAVPVAEAIDPDQDKLDEGDLDDYDQETLAEDLAKEDEDRRAAARKAAARDSDD
jgi:hypothetical protein